MMKTIIEVKQLCKSYRSGAAVLKVLDHIDLKIRQGDFISLMGPSGSGKSTFLNIIGTMDAPDAGEILIAGKDVTHMPENQLAEFRLNHIGFVFQFHYLLPEFSIEENVAMPLMIRGMQKHQALERSREMLDYLGMSDRGHHFPAEISGGEKQRAVIGRALINAPDILLADEPTGNLDQETGERVLELFKKIQKDMNQTFFLVTHNERIARIAEINYLLDNGSLIIKAKA
ncbi:MAG: ABC transporter ATP-binding protein [Candidatus Marinimicrobia bacterium]|nr:ABC transporter ATP-binding protein [Candidatus Neomarinimicrobiota bacterium]